MALYLFITLYKIFLCSTVYSLKEYVSWIWKIAFTKVCPVQCVETVYLIKNFCIFLATQLAT